MLATMKIKNLAEQLSNAFETRARTTGEEFVCLKDGSPDWMRDVIRSAHGDAMPNDTIYEFCRRAAEAIAESEEDPSDAIAEIEADVYTSRLTSWLNASPSHVDYLTQAMVQTEYRDGFALLSYAQYLHIQEVGGYLLAALEEIETEEE